MPSRSAALMATLSCFVALHASAQGVSGHDRPITVSRASPLVGQIRLDGHLSEPAWATASVTDAFTQIEPDEGQPATQKTEVRILYDDAALYVGVRLHDNGPITGHLGRRDMALGDSDWFGLAIDSYHDHRTAFVFDVNPVGVRRDEIKTIDVDDNSWDPVWDVAVSVDSAGWTAEYRVPFSQLRFGNADVHTWGIQFERLIGRRAEYAVSTFSPRSERGGVPRYGHLEGLQSILAGKRLEVLPYVVGRAEFVDPGANPFRTDHDKFSSAGVDVLLRATTNLTVNATFNPDFGQVEVDPAVVNLGVYETFFDEKRPFFIEGNEIFDFGAGGTSGGQMFYSRRIGRSPTLFAPSAEADAPTSTTILGAAKLSGKVGGWSVGLLDALTDRERARFLTPGSAQDARMTVEPLSNYLVGRARRELRNGQSLLGLGFTAVHRHLDEDPVRDALHNAAYAGGLDFRHEFGRRTWVVRGDAEFSRVEGTTDAIRRTQRLSNHFFQRPDADHLDYDTTRTSLNGYSVNVALGKQQGRHWRGEIASAMTSPGYEVNDLGFSYRTDRRDFAAQMTYVENQPGTLFRRWQVQGNGRMERNYDWEPILTLGAINGFFQTNQLWTIQFNAQRLFHSFDDRLTRGGPIAIRPRSLSGTLRVTSDPRKDVTLAATVNGEDEEYGGWNYTATIGLGIKASTRWNLTLGPTFFRGHTPAQFVTSVADAAATATYGRRYVFTPLDQTEIGLETRFNFTFTPRLSLETYVQPLLSTGDYGGAIQLVAPRTFDFSPYPQAIPNLDFNLRSLRGNAVLRWEWRPGSTMFVAWQQNRSNVAPLGDFDFRRDRRALFGAAPDNIFLVKVSYWLNP